MTVRWANTTVWTLDKGTFKYYATGTVKEPENQLEAILHNDTYTIAKIIPNAKASTVKDIFIPRHYQPQSFFYSMHPMEVNGSIL